MRPRTYPQGAKLERRPVVHLLLTRKHEASLHARLVVLAAGELLGARVETVAPAGVGLVPQSGEPPAARRPQVHLLVDGQQHGCRHQDGLARREELLQKEVQYVQDGMIWVPEGDKIVSKTS